MTAPPSIRATLRHLPFRALLSGGTVFFVGNAMQVMATAWPMLEISGSSFLAALVLIAAVAMAAGLLLARPFPLRMGALDEVTQAPLSQDLFVTHEPSPEAGPVAVEIGYRVRPEVTEEFLDAVRLLRAPRRRDGATLWRVCRDLSDPTRFCERFIVTSWADYLHQRARGTLADQEIEAQLRGYLLAGEVPNTQHYIAER